MFRSNTGIHRPRTTALLAAACVTALWVPSASAYEERIHYLITESLFPDDGSELPPPTEEQLQQFREELWIALHEAADQEHKEFLSQFASEPHLFTSASLKALLLLNQHFSMHGFDTAPEEPLTEGRLRALASRWPDDDRRNQDRHRFNEEGEILIGPDGDPLPEDPAILHMGRSVGLSSQAHAHYELFGQLRSDAPSVLMKEPRLFSIPADARSFGRDYAAMYERLALIAQSLDTPAARWLSTAFEGNALHHIQDACNQIHTVQVGEFAFFRAAWTEVLVRDLLTVGGLLAPRYDLKTLGVRFLTNHHLFIEELMAYELLGAVENPEAHPHGARLLAALKGEDHFPTKESMLLSIPAAQSSAAAAMLVIADQGSQEVPELYQLTQSLAASELMSPFGRNFEQGHLENFLARPLDDLRGTHAFDRFFLLHERAMERCGTVLRQWKLAVSETPRDAAERLLQSLFVLHHEKQIRVEQVQIEPPQEQGLNHVVIGGYVLLLGGIAAGVVLLVKRRRRS